MLHRSDAFEYITWSTLVADKYKKNGEIQRKIQIKCTNTLVQQKVQGKVKQEVQQEVYNYCVSLLKWIVFTKLVKLLY